MAAVKNYENMFSFEVSLTWSEEFSAKAIVEMYKNQLPITVKITSGYNGCHGMQEFSIEEMYCFVEARKQKRAVFGNTRGLFISIPLDHQRKFHIVDSFGSAVGPARPLAEVIPTCSSTGVDLHIMLGDDEVVGFFGDADSRSVNNLGILEYEDTYSEKYLVCYPIQKNVVVDHIVVIPAYVPIGLSVAVQSSSESPGVFSDLMKRISVAFKTLDRNRIEPCADIVVLRENPASEYTYITPTSFLRYQAETKESSTRPFVPFITQNQSQNNVQGLAPIKAPAIQMSPQVGRRLLDRAVPTPPASSWLNSKKTNEDKIKPTSDAFTDRNTHLDSKVRIASRRWKCLTDVPTVIDLETLTTEDVCNCLELLGMKQHIEGFRQRMADGRTLRTLSCDDLFQRELGMTMFEVIKLDKFFKDGWRPKLHWKDG